MAQYLIGSANRWTKHLVCLLSCPLSYSLCSAALLYGCLNPKRLCAVYLPSFVFLSLMDTVMTHDIVTQLSGIKSMPIIVLVLSRKPQSRSKCTADQSIYFADATVTRSICHSTPECKRKPPNLCITCSQGLAAGRPLSRNVDTLL